MNRATVVRALTAVVFCAALLQLGCSGGGTAAQTTGSNNSTPPPPPLLITTSSLPQGILGLPYNQQLQASGGTPPYTWTTFGSLQTPCAPGLSLSPAGLLSGTPTGPFALPGAHSCFLQVTDSSSPPKNVKQTLTLFLIQPLALGPLFPNPPPSVRHPYFAQIPMSGGFGPFTWTISSGSLPPGLALTQGTISGVPTARGTFNFTVQVTDTGPPQQTASQPISLTVVDLPEITTTSPLPLGLINKPYSAVLQAIGGTPPYTWSVDAASVPPGMKLDPAAGTLSGTPTVTSNQFMFFTVTDSSVPPQAGTAGLELVINPLLSFTAPSTLPDGVQTQPYTAPMPFQGGLPPYFVTVLPGGALPAGMSIAGSGGSNVSFAGSPSSVETANFTLSVQDGESPPVTIQQAFSIRVNAQLVLHNVLPPPGAVGLPYSFQFQVTGGLPPLHWIAPNTIAGLTVNSTGLMSGTPTESGPFDFAVIVQDSANPFQTSALEVDGFQVYDKLRVNTSILPPIAPNVPVSMQLSGFGGTGNYSWTSGPLPPGLTLSPSGVLSGQASSTGSFSIDLQLNDAGPPAQTAKLTVPFTVKTALGRNDSVAKATPLSNGSYPASVSPFSDPPTGVANPDSDYYALTADPGATVTIEIRAQRLSPPSPLDSVLEIVDGSNKRLSLCGATQFSNDPCLNDDLPDGTSTDSVLTVHIPSSNPGPLTFYAHVLDFRGNARPDFIYTIAITGAN